MGYLISQIILCLIAATLLGLILGWLLRSILCRKSDTEELQNRLHECEGDNTQLRSRVSTLTAKSGGISSINDDQSPSGEIALLKQQLNDVTAERDSLISDFELNQIDTNTVERDIHDSSPLTQNKEIDPQQLDKIKASAGYATAGSSFNDQANSDMDSNESDITTNIPEQSDIETSELEMQLENAKAKIAKTDEELRILTGLISDREVELEKLKAGGGLAAATFAAEAGIQADAEKDTYDIQEIEGIGAGFGRRLRDQGIETTLDLLSKIAEEEGLSSLSKATSIEPFIIRKWVSMADLMRIPGVRGQFSELVEASGVPSVNALANQTANHLTNTMTEVNETEHRTPVLPTQGMVEEWIRFAKNIDSK